MPREPRAAARAKRASSRPSCRSARLARAPCREAARSARSASGLSAARARLARSCFGGGPSCPSARLGSLGRRGGCWRRSARLARSPVPRRSCRAAARLGSLAMNFWCGFLYVFCLSSLYFLCQADGRWTTKAVPLGGACWADAGRMLGHAGARWGHAGRTI